MAIAQCPNGVVVGAVVGEEIKSVGVELVFDP